jgi:hypothetical protein
MHIAPESCDSAQRSFRDVAALEQFQNTVPKALSFRPPPSKDIPSVRQGRSHLMARVQPPAVNFGLAAATAKVAFAAGSFITSFIHQKPREEPPEGSHSTQFEAGGEPSRLLVSSYIPFKNSGLSIEMGGPTTLPLHAVATEPAPPPEISRTTREPQRDITLTSTEAKTERSPDLR